MGWFSDFVSDPIGTLGDTGQKVINTVKENPLAAAALIGAGYYFSPSLGAWMNPATGGTIAGTEAGAAAGATEMTAQQTLEAIGAEQATGKTAAETLAAIEAEQAASGAAGGIAGASGTGAGLGALGTAGLISGGLGLAGGLLGGNAASKAASTASSQQAALANKLLGIGKFTPVGVTTTFGTSNFKVDPTTGQITSAGYALTPEAQAIQDAIMGSNRQSLSDITSLQSLGRQYIAQSPQEAAQSWLKNQQALLAPSREQSWANLANQDYNRGTTGLKVAQGGALQAANPYATALANAQAQQDLQLAAQAQQAGQQQTAFGQGLLTGAYQPLTSGLGAASSLETLAQQPFGLSTSLANLESTAGARQAANYAGALGSSIATQQAANSYSPWATALQGAASNPLTSFGLMKLTGLG